MIMPVNNEEREREREREPQRSRGMVPLYINLEREIRGLSTIWVYTAMMHVKLLRFRSFPIPHQTKISRRSPRLYTIATCMWQM